VPLPPLVENGSGKLNDAAGNVGASLDLRKRKAAASLDIEHQTYISVPTITIYFDLVG
jgi:hypothetical protein